MKSEHQLIRFVSKKMALFTKEKFSCLDDLIYSVATFLDPRSKHLFQDLPESHQLLAKEYVLEFANEAEDTPITKKRKLDTSCDEINTDESAFNGFISEMFEHKTPSLTPKFDFNNYLNRSFSAKTSLTTWFSSLQPFIKELYLCICGIPAASSESERLFSASGYINSKYRSSMLSVCTFFLNFIVFSFHT